MINLGDMMKIDGEEGPVRMGMLRRDCDAGIVTRAVQGSSAAWLVRLSTGEVIRPVKPYEDFDIAIRACKVSR